MTQSPRWFARFVSWFNGEGLGILFTLAMSIFAILPFLAHPGLFLGHDTLHHLFRVAEYDRLWSSGSLVPRWAETFYFGYGSPVFSYYAPLTYDLSALFMRLFALDAIGAVHLLIVLCFPVMSAGMYLFMRAHVGRFGAALAALVYLYSPYIVFTEPVTRGDYPELLCFALFPWVAWRFECLLRTGRGRDAVLAALITAIFLLAHNLMSPLLFALLVGWLIWRALWQSITLRQFMVALLTAVLGAGLTGFFWLPIFLERAAVQLGNVPINIQSEQRHFFGFFVPLDRLLAFSPLTDAGATNGILLRLNLGLPAWVLALTAILGIVVLIRARFKPIPATVETVAQSLPNSELRTRNFFLSTQHLALSTYFAFAALALILLILPLSYGLWSSVALLNFMEFPWRLLGPLAFCLAVLAGLNALWIERLPNRIGSLIAVLLLISPILLALPALYIPPDRTAKLDLSQAAYLQAEITGAISPGTSARNDFLPRDVLVLPGATQSLLDDYADGAPINKLNPNSVPPDAAVTLAAYTPEAQTWDVSAPAAWTLETFIFNFPGWEATIDGQPVSLTSSQPHGFISIPVPSGDHTIHLSLAQTPARTLGLVVSLISLVALILFFLLRSPAQLNAPISSSTVDIPLSVLSTQYSVLLTAFLLTTVLTALLMHEGFAWINPPPGQVQIAQHQITYNLGDDIRVLGYDLSSATVRPGGWLEVVVYWYPLNQPDYNYSSFVHLSSGGPPLAQADKLHPSERATSEWTPNGRYLRDTYTLHIPESIPPGDYQLTVGLYTCDTRPPGECGNGDRLPITDSAGNSLGDILPLGKVQVSP